MLMRQGQATYPFIVPCIAVKYAAQTGSFQQQTDGSIAIRLPPSEEGTNPTPAKPEPKARDASR